MKYIEIKPAEQMFNSLDGLTSILVCLNTSKDFGTN